MKNIFYFILRGALLWVFISANATLRAEECGPYTGFCEGEPSLARKAELELACADFENKEFCIAMGYKINVPTSVIKICEKEDDPINCVGSYNPCSVLYETEEEAQKRQTENPPNQTSPVVVTWVENNIQGLEHLHESQKESVYRVVEAFYPRLVKWQEFRPFYDRLSQDPDWIETNPYFNDLEQGLYLRILGEGESLTDLPAYHALKGKTVEEVYPSFVGDTRLMDDIMDESSRQTMIAQSIYINEPTGIYNLLYNVMGGFVYVTLLTEQEFNRVTELYQSAKERGQFHFTENYPEINQYFAKGVAAYFSVSIPEICLIPDWNYDRRKMEESDPAFFEFMESLVQKGGA